MTPEAAESLTKSQIPEKGRIEKPFRVKGQPPNTLYPNIANTETHPEISKAAAAPKTPKSGT